MILLNYVGQRSNTQTYRWFLCSSKRRLSMFVPVNQLPSKDGSFMVRKTRHIPDIYKAGCTNCRLCNPPLFGFAAMPREGYGRRTDDSAIPPLTLVKG